MKTFYITNPKRLLGICKTIEKVVPKATLRLYNSGAVSAFIKNNESNSIMLNLFSDHSGLIPETESQKEIQGKDNNEFQNINIPDIKMFENAIERITLQTKSEEDQTLLLKPTPSFSKLIIDEQGSKIIFCSLSDTKSITLTMLDNNVMQAVRGPEIPAGKINESLVLSIILSKDEIKDLLSAFGFVYNVSDARISFESLSSGKNGLKYKIFTNSNPLGNKIEGVLKRFKQNGVLPFPIILDFERLQILNRFVEKETVCSFHVIGDKGGIIKLDFKDTIGDSGGDVFFLNPIKGILIIGGLNG